MSRAPGLLLELVKTLRIMSDEMGSEGDGDIFNFPDTTYSGSLSRCIAVRNSVAQCDDDRDKAGKERLDYRIKKQVASNSPHQLMSV